MGAETSTDIKRSSLEPPVLVRVLLKEVDGMLEELIDSMVSLTLGKVETRAMETRCCLLRTLSELLVQSVYERSRAACVPLGSLVLALENIHKIPSMSMGKLSLDSNSINHQSSSSKTLGSVTILIHRLERITTRTKLTSFTRTITLPHLSFG